MFTGPNIVKDGLVLSLDAGSIRSFRGEPVINLYSIAANDSANNEIWGMPMGGTATGVYQSFFDIGKWNNNTIFKVTISAGTLASFSSFRFCVPSTFDTTYGTTRRLSAKIKMIKGQISGLSVHNGGGNSSHNSSIFTQIEPQNTPFDVIDKNGWFQLDTNVSGSYPFGQCVGIGIVTSDIEFLVTEMMLYPSSTFSFFTPTTRGTTVASGGGWADLSQNNNHGELVNGPTFNSSNFGSIQFDGVDDHILISNILMGNGNIPWSVNVWTKTTTIVNALGQGSIISNSSGGPVYSMLGVNNGRIVYWTYQNNAWSQKLGNRIINDNNWHMLTWVNYSNNTMDMYVDGSLDFNVVNSTSGNNNPLNIIGGSWAGRYSGNISSIIINLNKSFTPQEVLQNYNATKNRYL